MTFDRAVILAVAAVGIVVSFSWLGWWDYAGIDTWDVVFALWQLMPFVLLLLLRRFLSGVGTVLIAALLAFLTVAGHVEMSRDDSSTASLGLIWFPIYFAGLVIVAWTIDAGIRRAVRLARRGKRPV